MNSGEPDLNCHCESIVRQSPIREKMRLLSCFTPRNSNSSPAHNDDRTKRSIEKAVEVGGSETLGSSPVNVSTCLKDAEKILVGRCLAGEQRAWEEVCQCYSGTIANVASLEK